MQRVYPVHDGLKKPSKVGTCRHEAGAPVKSAQQDKPKTSKAKPACPPFTLSQNAMGDLCALANVPPTHIQLQALADTHREDLTELRIHISDEHQGAVLSKAFKPLDLSCMGVLPKLTRVELYAIKVQSLHFTSATTPELTSLSASNIFDGVKMHLELPELVTLAVEHTWLEDEPNTFGESLTRCPNLELVQTYKFRGLTGSNYCVLPCCTHLDLWRSECTERIEILAAPQLSQLELNGAFSLKHVRLRELASATTQDALDLNAAERADMEELGADISKQHEYLLSGEASIDELLQAKVISELDLHMFEVDGVDIAGMHEESWFQQLVAERMQEHADSAILERRKHRMRALITAVEARPLPADAADPVRCRVLAENVPLSRASLRNLRENECVELRGQKQAEPVGMFMPGFGFVDLNGSPGQRFDSSCDESEHNDGFETDTGTDEDTSSSDAGSLMVG